MSVVVGHRARLARRAALTALAGVLLTACATTPPPRTGAGLYVVAAQNVWGSLAAQLGGERVSVRSIVDSPAVDPHDYEPTTADARAVATSDLTIVTGAGYDPWATRLVAANPSDRRSMLDVSALVGVPVGGNPHRWYSPDDVRRVIDAITADYRRLDPAHATFFDRLHDALLSSGLKEYFGLVGEVRQRFAGTPIGASESVVVPLAQALGLDLRTPDSFLEAVSEGGEPTARDKATIDQQISDRQISVYVYNSQNATPDVQRQVDAARGQGIGVVTVTETLAPAQASFQDWQVRQLRALRQALAEATGR